MTTKELGGCHPKGGKICITILLIINIILSAIAGYYSYQNYNLEIIRGGGKENFKIMNDFYQSQAFIDYVTEAQKQSIDGFDTSSSEQGATVENTPTTPTATAPQVLDQEAIAALKATGKIKGDPNAEITIIEYADANCSFCKRQIAQEKTIQTIMASYPNVNTVYKNMPVLGSVQEAQVIECFGANSSVEDYYTFIEAVYANNAGIDNLYTIVTSLGGDADAIRACVSDGTYESLVNTHMDEGRSFNITGTPASLVINNSNGQYKLIEGAYPASEFESAINTLLAS